MKIEKPVMSSEPPVLEQISQCNQVWDRMLRRLFGKQCITNVESLGHFIVLRQMKIYRTITRKDIDFFNVYKERSKELYDHDFFDEKGTNSTGKNSVPRSSRNDDGTKSQKENRLLNDKIEAIATNFKYRAVKDNDSYE